MGVGGGGGAEGASGAAAATAGTAGAAPAMPVKPSTSRLTMRPRGPEPVREPRSIPRSSGHRKEWLEACKGGKAPVSNFSYAGPMTETVLLGVLAMRAPNRRLEWDGENLKLKNAPELNQYVHREYRKGWTL